ncbi:MAG: pyridoxamine 5'-phosphate oxidase family protein [Verrucomicrobiota bacterium]
MKTSERDPIENLSGTAAAQKIREIAKSARICFFGTSPGKHPLDVVPMAVQDVDEAGNLWFLSGRSSQKNRHIAEDPRVQLLFANVGDSDYLSLHGVATISDSRADKEAHWTPIAKTWFTGGIDDPEVTVIKVEPSDGYYWDTEHGKMVATLKMAIGALTGKTMDDSVEGKVRP